MVLLAACEKTETRQTSPDGGKNTRTTKYERPPDDGRGNSRTGPREALVAALKLPQEEEREAAIAEIAWNVIDEDDPTLAAEALAALAVDGAPRLRLIQHLAMRTAERNPDEAAAWAETLGSENETAAAFGRIALVISEDDPERAARMLSETGVEGRDFNVALVQVLQRWTAKDAAAAAKWAALFPAGNFREASISAVVSEWAAAGPAAAFDWIASLEEPAIRGEALRSMAESLAGMAAEERQAAISQAGDTIRGDLEKELARISREAEDFKDEEFPE